MDAIEERLKINQYKKKKKASKAAEWSIKIKTKIYSLKASISYWWRRSQAKVCWGCVNSWYRLFFQETSMRREEIRQWKGKRKNGPGETRDEAVLCPVAQGFISPDIKKEDGKKSSYEPIRNTLFSFEVSASILQKAGTWLHLETSSCAFSLQVWATASVDSCLPLFSLENYYWLQERSCSTFYNNCELSLW